MIKNIFGKAIKYISDKDYRFMINAGFGRYNKMSDEEFIKREYKACMGKALNLEDPKTYNEKLQWMKLYDRNPIYTQLVDKYAVKEYVTEKIGSEYVIPLVGGPWKSFDEIDFDKLPDRFVLKTSHDCGGVFVCKDKSKMDKAYAKKFLTKHLHNNYYLQHREWPYKDVEPCIFAEAYMSDSKESEQLTDYKFFCFDGEVKAMFVATDRILKNEETKFDFFDENFNHLPFLQGHPNATKLIECPSSFEIMKELASKLSKGFPQIRVDFYSVDSRIYFGELTFFHFGGITPFVPEEWDYKFGEWIKLPERKC